MKSTRYIAFKAAFLGLMLSVSGAASGVSAQVLSTDTGTAPTATATYGSCVITSFAASPTSTDNGKTSMLTWTTSGCMHTTLSGGAFMGTQILPMNHSISTGPLSGTTRYTLSANGQSNSATAYATVAVADTQYAYSYACDPIELGGDPNCVSAYRGKFITTAATNVGSETARLNGIALDTPTTFSVYFEYGTTPNLGYATYFQTLGNVQTFYVHQTIAVAPSTRYYYRIVSQVLNGPTIRGDIMSFTTAAKDAPYKTYVGDTGSGTTTSSSGTTTGSTSTVTTSSTGGSTVQSGSGAATTISTLDNVSVKVTTKSDEIRIGDTVEYTVEYANGTNKTLKDAALTIVFPQGFSIKQSTRGTTAGATVSAPLGTLTPGQSGSIFIEAIVGQNTTVDSTLVTSATLDYALSNGKRDSAVGYVLNHASATNAIAGLALGGGFFPSTIFGWLITIIIILTIILIARRIAKQKEAGHGHGGEHH